MSYELTGIIKMIGAVETVSDKFKKREVVITTDLSTPYPQHISGQLTQDKVELVHNMQIGDEIKVAFNIRGREWNGPQGVKYFNTIEIWKVELIKDNGGVYAIS